MASRMTRWLGPLAAATLLLGSGPGGEGVAGEPYKLGATIPLSGPLATFATQFIQGLDMAVEEVNAKGGVQGHPLRILYEDSKAEPVAGVAAMRKLISVDRVPIVITIFTNVALAQLPLGEETKTVIFSAGVTYPHFGARGKGWAFRNSYPSNKEAELLAELASQKLGLKNVAVFFVNNDAGIAAKEAFTATFERLGGKVLVAEAFALGSIDFRPQLIKARGLNPQSVSLFGQSGKEEPTIVKQMSEMGFRAQILTFAGTPESPDFLPIAGKAAEGAIYTSGTFYLESPEPHVHQFIQGYRQKYGRNPGLFSATHYDAVYILAQAIERGGFTADGIKRALLEIRDFPGVTGKTTFTATGDAEKPLMLKTIKDGKPVPY